MIDQRQAALLPGGRLLRLSATVDWHDGKRTRTGRTDDLLAACGRSQKYTYTEYHRQITSFKEIQARDRNIYRSATLDCIVPPGT
jgi:hypothetical protein